MSYNKRHPFGCLFASARRRTKNMHTVANAALLCYNKSVSTQKEENDEKI